MVAWFLIVTKYAGLVSDRLRPVVVTLIYFSRWRPNTTDTYSHTLTDLWSRDVAAVLLCMVRCGYPAVRFKFGNF